MKNGIHISLAELRSVEVAEDGKTAVIGGGALDKTVTDTLWAVGKQTGNKKSFPCYQGQMIVSVLNYNNQRLEHANASATWAPV